MMNSLVKNISIDDFERTIQEEFAASRVAREEYQGTVGPERVRHRRQSS
jgi:hypothetical protein